MLRKVISVFAGIFIFSIFFFPVRFLGDVVALNIRESIGRNYLVGLVIFLFPLVLSIVSALLTYLLSGKNRNAAYTTFGILFLFLLLAMSKVLLP